MPPSPTPASLLAFIHIEKTAGETMKWILRSSFGLSHCDISPGMVFQPLSAPKLAYIRRFYPNLRSIAGHPVTPYNGLEQTFARIDYFTFLRDPRKQVASYFQYMCLTLKKRQPDDFESWIQSDWPRNMQTRRICAQPDAARAAALIEEKNIFTGLTERFDESLLLLQTLRAPDLRLGYTSRNEASRNDLAARLLADQRSRALIEDAVREDLKLYEWARTVHYPAHQEAFRQQTGQAIPASFGFEQEGFHSAKINANRLYRNLVYKQADALYRLLHRGR